jgi:hypothetical protein
LVLPEQTAPETVTRVCVEEDGGKFPLALDLHGLNEMPHEHPVAHAGGDEATNLV